MAFVNEYVSDEDINKYGLEEVRLRFNPQFRKSGLPSNFQYDWVIDREKNVYLMRVKVGRDDISNRVTWVLSWKGNEITVQTDRMPGGSLSFSESPYKIIWGLVKVMPNELLEEVTEKELLATLKEALTIFGDGGVRHQVPNTIVEFNF